MNKIKRTLLLIILLANSFLFAQNPLVTHIYTADPTARVFDGKLYVYPSSDTIPPEGTKAPRFCMPGYNVFSLENGATWKDHGRILSNNDVPWGQKDVFGMWAPDCVKKDGKYYYYFPAKDAKTGHHKIGMGVSHSPTGPFKWDKKPMKGVNGIDPGILIDDDNKAYMFWAHGTVAQLKDNMRELATKPIKIQGLPNGYREAMFPFKKDGIYYLTFAHVFHGEGYTIGYAIADNPLGPYEYMGKIMDNIDNGTNHHSVVNYNGDWILFYHWWDISGVNKLRSMRADYMTFVEKGKYKGEIKKVTPTLRGIGTPTIGDTIQVDRYNEIFNAKTAFIEGTEAKGWMVCEAKTFSYVRFNRVDFGNGEAKKLLARVACGQRFGRFEVHIDSRNGPKIAEYKNKYTGGWSSWETIESKLLKEVKGIHDLYVVFIGENGTVKTINLNWLLLTK